MSKAKTPFKVADVVGDVNTVDHVVGKNYDHVIGKNYDPMAKVIIGPKGDVVSEVSKKRNELLEAMLTEIQNSLMLKLSGIGLSGKVDIVGNNLYEMQTYGDSLRAAIAVILKDYPIEDNSDLLLTEMRELCEVLSEGVSRSIYHLDELKRFSEDVKSIQTEIYNRMASLRFEMPT